MGEKNLTFEQMQERVSLYKRLARNIDEMSDIRAKIWELEKDDVTEYWANTRMDFWEVICQKYDMNDLLNCYGDIFFVQERGKDFDGTPWYIGKRVLWNLSLSEELYKITRQDECDADGEYDYSIYDIKLHIE